MDALGSLWFAPQLLRTTPVQRFTPLLTKDRAQIRPELNRPYTYFSWSMELQTKCVKVPQKFLMLCCESRISKCFVHSLMFSCEGLISRTFTPYILVGRLRPAAGDIPGRRREGGGGGKEEKEEKEEEEEREREKEKERRERICRPMVSLSSLIVAFLRITCA